MLKIIGSLLIIATCTAIGFQKSRELGQHVKELEELRHVFSMFQSELNYMKITFEELFCDVQRKTTGHYNLWLNDLSEKLRERGKGTFDTIWTTSIETHFKETHLTKEELQGLKQIGKNLSSPDAISLYLEELSISIQRTREEEKSKKKLYQSMGIMAGIFLVIVLV